MLKYLIIIVLLFVACQKKETTNDESGYQEAWKEYLNNAPTEMDENEWKLVSHGDTAKVLEVSYKDEIGLQSNTVYCMVVWEHKKTGDYKLTAPWIDKFILIKKSNILDFMVRTVKKEEAKI